MKSKINRVENPRGILLVLSGPSGVGKGTVGAKLRKSSNDLIYSVSATTRQPRAGEREAIDYFFKTRVQFEQMIAQNELLEWAEYVGNYYGTPKKFVNEMLQTGKNVVLEIEVQGAQKVKQQCPEAIFIFLLPPSLEELRNRICTRGSETEELISLRMQKAIEEIKLIENYDYAIINDHVDEACTKIQAILLAERCRQHRNLAQILKWINEVK